MNKLMIAAAAAAAVVVFAVTPALADEDPSAEEVAKIKEVIAGWGCEGGSFEKESEASGVFEAEDVKCKGGQYDFRLDKDFKVFVITAD